MQQSAEVSRSSFISKLYVDNELIVHPALAIGLGLHFLWAYACFYQAFPAFYITDPNVHALFINLRVVSWLVTITIMLLMACFIDRITYIIRRQNLQISVACIMALGTACLFVAQYTPEVTLIIIGNILSGAAAGFLVLIWGEAYRRREIKGIVLNGILALVLAFAGFALALRFLPATVGGALFCVIPLFEITALFFAMHGGSAFFHPQQFTVSDDGARMPVFGIREVPTFRKLRVRRSKLLVRMAIPGLLFGLAFGPLCKQAFSIVGDIIKDGGDLLMPVLLASGLSLGVVLVVLALNRNDDSESFY
ncbi:MAG: hypothetical protein LBR39_07585, partial [Coriobacteriales bacterium]|nr:hypothetical protein [Coriobacteriales bacterium]